MKRALPTLLLSALALPSYALAQDTEEKPERWYEVEIIVFETLNVSDQDSEYWPRDVDKSDLNKVIELIPNKPKTIEDEFIDDSLLDEALPLDEENVAAVPVIESARAQKASGVIAGETPEEITEEMAEPVLPTPYKLLAPEEYQLHGAFAKLKENENYQPLIHVAWRQVIPPRATPDLIHLHSDLPLPVLTPNVNEAVAESDMELPPVYEDNLSLELPVEMMFEEDELPKTIDGTVSLGLGRYIHVGVDLALFKPLQGIDSPPAYTLPQPPQMDFIPFAMKAPALAEPQEPELPAEFFQLKGNIRMPSGEMHYLDHPHGGVLIMFTRYELPEPELEESEEELFPEG